MAIFVALGNITDDGIRNLEAMSIRHKRAVERAEKHGAKVIGSYALLGQYDFLVILEAPDAKTAISILTKEAQRGNVRYQTMVAMPMDEFAELV